MRHLAQIVAAFLVLALIRCFIAFLAVAWRITRQAFSILPACFCPVAEQPVIAIGIALASGRRCRCWFHLTFPAPDPIIILSFLNAFTTLLNAPTIHAPFAVRHAHIFAGLFLLLATMTIFAGGDT